MGIIKVILFFILPANLTWLFLLKWKVNEKTSNSFLLLVSYGIGPLISGLFFYYLIWFFPQKSSSFYEVILLTVWFFVLLFARDKIKEASDVYRSIALVIKKDFSIKKYSAYSIVLLITIIFSIQALVYPISENDSAWYFAQSEAFYQSKDARWYESGAIILNGTNQYAYNKMIRPGIPAFMASSFLLGQKESNYFIFSFFFVYYYYLLIGMLLLVVSRLAIELKKDPFLSRILVFLFFVFYWNMTRFYIFNNKEVVIYFLALAGIYLVYELILEKNRDIKKEVLLGIVFGLNSFVNMHGILIGIFSLLTLFFFSKLPFWQRIKQVLLVFCVSLFFSAFELVQSFSFMFLNTIRSFFGYETTISTLTDKTTRVIVNANGSSQVLVGDQAVKAMHAQSYQMNSLKDLYLKGKLQAITNVGAYGFYFLSFLLILVMKFKEVVTSVFGKTILLFVAIYYIVIIDPLNLNKNDLAIVLSGSPKYNMFVALLSIILVAVYFDSIARSIFKYIFRNRLLLSVVSLVGALLLCVFRKDVISLGLKLIMSFVQIDRDVSFYANKIELFYYFLFILVVLFGIILAIFYFAKIIENTAYRFFFVLCLLFMTAPFFIVNVGKVPLSKTLSLLSEDREVKLQNIIYFGDLFRVYYHAKNTLPPKTPVSTSFSELYVYNNYLQLRVPGDSMAKYGINRVCSGRDREIYRAGAYVLCQS